MDGWTAVLPLVGVAVGALLQHWLSRSAETRKQLALLRSQAHVDYLRAVAKAAHASSQDARRVAVTDAADAKARIAVYGSTAVVHALARFEEAGPALDNARSTECFLCLVAAMRKTAGEVSPRDLELVLIGPQAIAAQRAASAPAEHRPSA
jgi:hypothetical protein